MQNHNNFSEETRSLFETAYQCWICSTNKCDCLHHTVGRGEKESNLECSPLNVAPLCNAKCHICNHGFIRREEQVKRLLNKTYDYLKKERYQMTNLDVLFLEKYAKFY